MEVIGLVLAFTAGWCSGGIVAVFMADYTYRRHFGWKCGECGRWHYPDIEVCPRYERKR